MSTVSTMTTSAENAGRTGASSGSSSSSAPSATSPILTSPAVIGRWAPAVNLSAPIRCISERRFVGINLREPRLKHVVVVDETVELTRSANVRGYFADGSCFPNGFVTIPLHDPLEFLLDGIPDAFSTFLRSLLVFPGSEWSIARRSFRCRRTIAGHSTRCK